MLGFLDIKVVCSFLVYSYFFCGEGLFVLGFIKVYSSFFLGCLENSCFFSNVFFFKIYCFFSLFFLGLVFILGKRNKLKILNIFLMSINWCFC